MTACFAPSRRPSPASASASRSREIDAMSREELAAIAHDLSLSPDDIRTAVRRGPGVGVEAEAMMAAFGLDPADPRLASFSTREAARTCLNCEGRERCHAELEAGTARLNAAAFCPNAETFESAWPGRKAEGRSPVDRRPAATRALPGAFHRPWWTPTSSSWPASARWCC